MRPSTILFFLALVWPLTAGCTHMPAGPSAPGAGEAYGPPASLRVCILKDEQLETDTARGVMRALQARFRAYGLQLSFPWMRAWRRPAFRHAGILQDVAQRPLEAPCDRLLALVGRDGRDFLWGMLLPEILGAVETSTHTKGYVVAATGSLNQLLSFTPPRQAAAHEMLHLLGLDHGDDADTLRDRIRSLKQAAARNRRSGRDFFPALTASGTLLNTRRAVDAHFRIPSPEICVADAGGRGCS